MHFDVPNRGRRTGKAVDFTRVLLLSLSPLGLLAVMPLAFTLGLLLATALLSIPRALLIAKCGGEGRLLGVDRLVIDGNLGLNVAYLLQGVGGLLFLTFCSRGRRAAYRI